MAITLYGIATCDTCRKALKALKSAGIDHQWVDVRTDPVGIPPEVLNRALREIALTRLVNKSSKTWRDFPDTEKQATAAAIETADHSALSKLFTDHPTLMKRPLIVTDTACDVGFSAAQQTLLGTAP